MIGVVRSLVVATGWLLQRLMLVAVAGLGLGLLGYTIASAFGYAPWLEMTATFGGTPYDQAGSVVQVGLTFLMLGLCFFPARQRPYHGIGNVSSAVSDCYGRRGARLSNVALCRPRWRVQNAFEFDSVRERMAFLRDHPDLAELEPSVLEVASQMSHVSKELAQVYSDRSVARARDFLIQRQQEIEEFNTRLDEAKAVATQMRVWVDKVELEESVAEAQLTRLCDELTDILPEIHLPEGARTIPPRSVASDQTEDWDSADPYPNNDDNRIVALLARRAAE